MIACPNKKCQSQLPNSFRHCIYCGSKLPKTEENKPKEMPRPKVSVVDIGIVVGAVAALAIILFFVLTKF